MATRSDLMLLEGKMEAMEGRLSAAIANSANRTILSAILAIVAALLIQHFSR